MAKHRQFSRCIVFLISYFVGIFLNFSSTLSEVSHLVSIEFGLPQASARTVGRKAAEDYMKQSPEGASESKKSREPEEKEAYRRPSSGDHFERYLQIYMGGFLKDKTYNWGETYQENKGNWFFGFTYRLGEWSSSADMSLRVELQHFDLNQGTAKKVSTTFLFTLPDAASKFPVYFGVSVGPGIFIKQLKDESPISLDYQLLLGVRFFDVINTTGFFVETGIKDHVLLLSDGQFAEGYFMSAGAVFAF